MPSIIDPYTLISKSIQILVTDLIVNLKQRAFESCILLEHKLVLD